MGLYPGVEELSYLQINCTPKSECQGLSLGQERMIQYATILPSCLIVKF